MLWIGCSISHQKRFLILIYFRSHLVLNPSDLLPYFMSFRTILEFYSHIDFVTSQPSRRNWENIEMIHLKWTTYGCNIGKEVTIYACNVDNQEDLIWMQSQFRRGLNMSTIFVKKWTQYACNVENCTSVKWLWFLDESRKN